MGFPCYGIFSVQKLRGITIHKNANGGLKYSTAIGVNRTD